MAFLITVKNLDPGADPDDDIVAVAESVTPGLRPEHPIVIPPPAKPPLVIWGPGDNRPTPPIFLPPQKPGEIPKPPFVIWGPGDNRPTPPIVIPPLPVPPQISGPDGPWITPPIYLPPQAPGDGKPPIIGWDPCDDTVMPPIYIPPQLPGGPGKPPVIWGGGDVPFPDNPIANVPGAGDGKPPAGVGGLPGNPIAPTPEPKVY